MSVNRKMMHALVDDIFGYLEIGDLESAGSAMADLSANLGELEEELYHI